MVVVVEDEGLLHPRSITANQSRTDFRPPYIPLFLGAESHSLRYSYIKRHSLTRTSNASRENIFDPTDDMKGTATPNPVGKITDRKPGFSEFGQTKYLVRNKVSSTVFTYLVFINEQTSGCS